VTCEVWGTEDKGVCGAAAFNCTAPTKTAKLRQSCEALTSRLCHCRLPHSPRPSWRPAASSHMPRTPANGPPTPRPPAPPIESPRRAAVHNAGLVKPPRRHGAVHTLPVLNEHGGGRVRKWPVVWRLAADAWWPWPVCLRATWRQAIKIAPGGAGHPTHTRARRRAANRARSRPQHPFGPLPPLPPPCPPRPPRPQVLMNLLVGVMCASASKAAQHEDLKALLARAQAGGFRVVFGCLC
jgi:hypothetical protein